MAEVAIRDLGVGDVDARSALAPRLNAGQACAVAPGRPAVA
jgi:hypothetical protein